MAAEQQAPTARRRTTPPAVRAMEYYLLAYRRTWRGTVVTSFLTPVLFLAAMGLGLGMLVDQNGTADLGGVEYVVFIAPGLLAFAAMQTGVAESSWPVLGNLKWVRTYFAQIASPLTPVDVAGGHFLYVTFRLLQGSVAFLLVMVLFGATSSWMAVLAIPAAVLTGLAFATPMTAFAVSRETEQGFSAIFRFVVTPLFLFSGIFFPVTQLPTVLRWIAYVTPLWHGVALCRGLALGTIGALAALGHVAVLCVFAGVGLALAFGYYRQKLTP
jgi:lipooligosaccharide transport system permease protein